MIFIVLYVIHLVPEVAASIVESGSPVALRSYSLTCNITAPPSLELTSGSYRWTRNGVTLSQATTKTLTLNPLPQTENNVIYRCIYSASSSYLTDQIVATSAMHIIGIGCMLIITYSIVVF